MLATRHLLARGGTETWLESLYEQLSQTHEVSVFACTGNQVFPQMRHFDPESHYDVALVNHGPAFRAMRRASIDVIVFTSHGIRPAIEWPLPGADAYVAVSEDIQRFIPYSSRVIRNPINVRKFKPSKPIHASLKRAAFMSNNQGWVRSVVEEAADLAGVELRVFGGEHRTNDPVAAMNWADLVIGVGRTALEGLACGRNVICLDHLGGEGLLTEENIEAVRTSNFSGRLYRRWYTPRALAEEMALYDPERSLRQYVVDNHSPERIAKDYLDLASSIPHWRKYASRAVRHGPDSLVSKRVTTAIDPLIRELRGATAPDGRPGVLADIWPSGV